VSCYDALNRGKIRFLIIAERGKTDSCSEPFNPVNIIDNIVQKNEKITLLHLHTKTASPRILSLSSMRISSFGTTSTLIPRSSDR